MEKKPVTDAEILNNVISALNESTHSLSIKLGYKSPASVYHVVNGINNLSSGMIDRIVKVFPNVSIQYLNEGVLPVILTDEDLRLQMNLLNLNTSPELEFLKKLASMPDRIDNIERMLKSMSGEKTISSEEE